MSAFTQTIKLGAARPSLSNFEITSLASSLLEKTDYQQEELSLDLVGVSLTELGFTEAPLLAQIYDAATKKGYGLCPAEVGPRLREAYSGTDGFAIAMVPIDVPNPDFHPGRTDPEHANLQCIYVLRGEDGGKLILSADTLGDPAGDEPWWDLSAQFVFVAPRS